MQVDDVRPLATDDLAHPGGDLRVVEIDGPEGSLRQRLMGKPGQVCKVEWCEAIDDDPFGRNLASRSNVEARLGRHHDDLVILGQCPGHPTDIDLGAALDERRVEVADEADFHAAC